MKWIRWQGLLAFLAISAVLLAFWFLFIDHFIKRHIEKAGTALVGAKVELDKADLTLFPLGLTLTGLKVTNPDEPMKNSFEAARISFAIDGVDLIRKKYIIDEMAVEGVRLNTERKRSGAIGRQKKAESPEKGALKLLAFELPDLKEVLKKEKIESVDLIKGLDSDIRKDRAKFEKDDESLPDEKKIREYRSRIEKLKQARGFGGVVGGAGELLSLKNEIQDQLNRISVLKDEVGAKAADYGKRVQDAAAAPERDIQKIVKKYSITPEGLANLSGLFIGGKLREWVEDGLRWRAKINRVVSPEGAEGGIKVQKTLRGKGVDVQFPEYRPVPDFLIRRASVSVNIPSGDISGLATNITGDQDMLGSPARIRLSGERLKGLTSALLEGEMNRVMPRDPRDNVNFTIRGYKLHDFDLTQTDFIGVALKDALADFDVRAELRGGSIKASIGSSVRSALIQAAVKGTKNEVLDTIAAALSKVNAFKFNADVTGTLESYRLSVTSDLDRVLSDAAGGVLRERLAPFQKGVQDSVFAKTSKPLSELNNDFKGLLDVNGIVSQRFAELNKIFAEATKGGLPGLKLPF